MLATGNGLACFRIFLGQNSAYMNITSFFGQTNLTLALLKSPCSLSVQVVDAFRAGHAFTIV